MPEFIEFVKACGTVILPLVAIILSIASLVVSVTSMILLIRITFERKKTS
jgi:hypothetical protein